MQPLPYTHHLARLLFYAVIAVFVAGELANRIRSASASTGPPDERLSFFVVIASIAAGFATALLAAADLGYAAITTGREVVFAVGAVVAVAGVLLRQWAVVVLGGSYTVEVRAHPEQPVVESGPFRLLAHPSYTGMTLSSVGIGMMLGNWVSLAALALIPAAGLLYRIRVEERVLLTTLGERYRRFLDSRSRMIPGIW